MDYARFVRLRRPVWDGLERQLAASRDRRGRDLGYDDLEEMALRYRQVLHDHALAASRFPGTAAARRLHGLAIEGTRRLTGERGERTGPPRLLRPHLPARLPAPARPDRARRGPVPARRARGGWRWPSCGRRWG